MNFSFKYLLSFCTVFIFTHSSFAHIFEYSKNVYGLDLQRCQNEAASLAKHIAEATGGTTEAAYCASLTKGGFDIRVLTNSNAEPELELAVFGFGLIEYHYPGQKGPVNKRYSVISDTSVYSQLEDCLKALPAYESIFQTQTGLVPAAAQCARQSDYRYVAQVDAFGKTSRHLYEINLGLDSGMSSKEGLLDLTNYLISVGATPVTTGPPSTYLKLKYFADSEIHFSALDFERKNIFAKPEECVDALTAVRASLLALTQSKLVSLQCGKRLPTRYGDTYSMAAIFDISGTSEHAPKVDIFAYGQYPTYSECRAQVPAQQNSYCSLDIDIFNDFHGYSLNVMSVH